MIQNVDRQGPYKKERCGRRVRDKEIMTGPLSERGVSEAERNKCMRFPLGDLSSAESRWALGNQSSLYGTGKGEGCMGYRTWGGAKDSSAIVCGEGLRKEEESEKLVGVGERDQSQSNTDFIFNCS